MANGYNVVPRRTSGIGRDHMIVNGRVKLLEMLRRMETMVVGEIRSLRVLTPEP